MPFESNPAYKTPPWETKIWRYVGFSQFMWIMNFKQLHFHRVTEFSDPFEGTIPKAIKEIRAGELETDSPELQDLEQARRRYQKAISFAHNTAKKFVFANCWHMKETESAAMWDLYGDADKTIAIESTVGDLVSAFSTVDNKIHIGRIDYVDYYSPIQEIDPDDWEKIKNAFLRTERLNLHAPFLLKRREFSHERELRAILMRPFDNENPESGTNVEVNIGDLINRIWIAPGTPSWFSDTVRDSVLANDKLDFSDNIIQNSKLDSDPEI